MTHRLVLRAILVTTLLLTACDQATPPAAQPPQTDGSVAAAPPEPESPAGYRSPHIRFPDDAGHVDVTAAPYRADPTGEQDATAAFQRAIDDTTMHGTDAFGSRRVLYIPNGTYQLTAGLRFENDRPDGHSSEGGGPCILGESRDGVILKLDDNSPGFQDADNPVPVISTINQGKWGNVAFMLTLRNFTVDIGSGNPGASGIRYIASNQGSLRDITIRTSDPDRAGAAGVDMYTSSIPGPALIKHVRVEGFDYGVRVASPHYTMTLEHIELAHQRVAGIHNHQHSLVLRGIRSDNTVPALVSDHADGLVVMLESTLEGGAADQPAIINHGHMLLRNITTGGYAQALTHNEQAVAGSGIDEWVSSDASGLFDHAGTTLNLPVEETPAVPWDDPATWVSAAKFIDNPEIDLARDNWSDDSAAIQRAIDSMTGDQKTLYFPPGSYKIDKTIALRGSVRRVVGMWTPISTSPAIEKRRDPTFRIPVDKAETFYFDMINDAPVPRRTADAFLENRSKHDVVFQSVYIAHGPAYRGPGATGRLFLEDVCSLHHIFYSRHTGDHEELALPEASPQWDFGGQTVFARQFNPEFFGTMARSDGGRVWILGVKTETLGTMFHATGGARVEVLGGTFLPSYADPRGLPAFVIEDSAMNFTVAEHVGLEWKDGKQVAKGAYNVIITETHDGQTRSLDSQDALRRVEERGFVMPLYRSAAQ